MAAEDKAALCVGVEMSLGGRKSIQREKRFEILVTCLLLLLFFKIIIIRLIPMKVTVPALA